MLARDRQSSDDDRTGVPVCADDHGDDPRRPTGTAALAVGRAGVGVVGVGPALPRPDHLVGPPAAPGRQAGVGHPGCQRHPLPAVGLERGDGRGGVGQPPAPPPGGLAAAGTGPVGGGRRHRQRVRRLRRGGQARGLAGSPPGGRVRRQRHARRAGVHRLCAAAHADRVVALTPLAVVDAHLLRSRQRSCWAPGRCCPDRSIRRSSRSPIRSPCTFWSAR
jgi:hypothetical protein